MAPEDEDEIYNLLTKEVMTEKVSKDILERDEIGQRMFVEFAIERLTEGRNDKEEAQSIQDLKCHDRN